jgi:hypothetical protein
LKTNGSVSPDDRDEMQPNYQAQKPASVKSPGSRAGGRRENRRRRAEPGDQAVRYFVGRPAGDDGKPRLEQEVTSEPEGLVIAFKNDSRVYFVHEYRVTQRHEYRVAQRIEGNEVRLEKEPVRSAKRVSTANAS